MAVAASQAATAKRAGQGRLIDYMETAKGHEGECKFLHDPFLD